MIGRRGSLIGVMMAILVAFDNMATCQENIEAPGSLASGNEEVVMETQSTVPPAVNITVTSSNATVTPTTPSNATVAPVTGSTENPDDEKPITETIRTYIEDSVKSVKHAISKIGKFVGEFFEDAPTNSTTPANVSTTVSKATVTNATTVLPTTSK